MNYKDFTKEQLIERIEELEILNSELLKEKEEATRLEYAWTGNLGHWYWNFKTNKVTYNPLKVTGVKQYMGEELKNFIQGADKKMYEAKRNGKDQIVY